ncbi:MAG: 4-hydroxy-tetrahydrodipicolinate reductase [Acidimicrobiales bacterium]|jgi:4-hydroxy-tetrahydrodipicolinate reductase|nr:4-hydroxy-tetrahydrodipicolinate reductase [Acidimicrobiales bacterium]
MTNIRVGVLGAGGRMGATVCQAVLNDPTTSLKLAVDTQTSGGKVDNSEIEIERDLSSIGLVDVIVDFTVAEASRTHLPLIAEKGVHAIVGTSGLGEEDIQNLRECFTQSNCIIAPNFSISAVMMMRLAEIAAPHFDTIEIIEYHHNNKIDAPSGTAIATAEKLANASQDLHPDPTTKMVLEGARGATGEDQIPIHSIRMEGMLAHQEVLMGTLGQTLTIRQDSSDRSSFMPGVLLAIKKVFELTGVVVGLEAILDV